MGENFNNWSNQNTKWKLLVGGSIAAAIIPSPALAQCEPNSGSCIIVNDDDLVGDIEIEIPAGAANIVRITNTGTVTGSSFIQADEDESVGESVTVLNSGNVVGSGAFRDEEIFGIEAQHRNVTFTNSGTINLGAYNSNSNVYFGHTAASVTNEAEGASQITVTNSGTIRSTAFGASALAIAGRTEGISGAPSTSNISVSNGGTISSLGGAIFAVDPRFDANGLFNGTVLNAEVSAGLAVGRVSEAGTSTNISITNGAAGVIEAGGTLHFGRQFLVLNGQPLGFIPPRQDNIALNAPADFATVALAILGDTVIIRNDGIVRGGLGTLSTGNVNLTAPFIEAFDGQFNDQALLRFPNRFLAGAIHSFGDGRDTIINSSTGQIIGSIDLNGGDDRIENYGAITGNVFLRDGADTYVRGISATQDGTVDGGEGTDSAFIDITGGGLLAASLYSNFVNFENFGTVGNGAISLQGPLPFQTLQVSGLLEILPNSVLQTAGPIAITGSAGSDQIVNRGRIIGAVELGEGADVFNNFGAVDGSISLGDGDDRFIAQLGSSVTERISGGTGRNSLGLYLGGSLVAPQEVNVDAYSSFQQLDLLSGNASVINNLAVDRITLAAGSLFGQPGSTISASGGILVLPGAVFGSAGQVNGAVTVQGTLAPGASPGTMTVNGNVALASGSTTIFEFTPTVSDRLNVTGQVSIASGATLNLIGTRPFTPGVTHTLISATGGINGAFSTINQASTVRGFLRQSANALELLSTLQLASNATRPVTATANYLNASLIAGGTSAAIVDAFPSLVGTDGFARSDALSTLHPEAYASASQMGIETGLAVTTGLRSYDLTSGKSGAFVFAQGFGNWRKFGADPVSGVSKANVRTSGLFGGIGFASESFSIRAFVGKANARQPIDAIGALNKSEGVIAGGHLSFSSGVLGMGGSLVYDGGKATTNRTLFNGALLSSRYRLRGVTGDVYARLGFQLGSGWQLGPEVGLTHVSVFRNDAEEAGNTFALEVDEKREKATFIRGQVALSRPDPNGLSPWIAAGVTRQTGQSVPQAEASFAGAAGSFIVDGAQRERTNATVNAGLNAAISNNVAVYSRLDHEFGRSGSTGVSIGLRIRF